MSFPLSYLDFLAVTRTNKKTPIGDFLNEALTNSYVLSILLEGRGIEEITQGGTQIVDFIQIGTNGSFGFYAPGDQQTPVASDTMKQISQPWRFAQSNYAFEDEEIALNEADVDRFIKLKDGYESGCLTDQVQGTEDSLWAVPSNSDMESTTGRKPYSIPTFINEFTNTVPSGFTTIMGVNPATVIAWQNQRQGYTVSQLTNATSSVGLLQALLKMTNKVRFKPVNFRQAKKHQEADKMDRLMIITNLDGIVQYQNCLYSTNDRTASASDAGNQEIAYQGRALMYVTALDYAGIYSGALSGTTASQTNPLTNASVSNCAATGAPRYYFMNGDYMKPIFNSNRFMEQDVPIRGGQDRPKSYVQYYWTQQQLWCSSRKRQGIVYPSAL